MNSPWTGAHVRAFEFYQGVPKLVVPDNTKTGVTNACRYDPDLNPTHQEMAMHYGVGVVPARPWLVGAHRFVRFLGLLLHRAICSRSSRAPNSFLQNGQGRETCGRPPERPATRLCAALIHWSERPALQNGQCSDLRTGARA